MQTLILAGGGTGGHIYPAIAIAQEFKRQFPGSKIVFVGTPRGLENKIVPREGFPLKLIRIGALNNVSWIERIKTIIHLPFAFLKAIWIVLSLNPSHVIGVGGYASGPVMIAAWLLRKPTYLFEPNAYPGFTNRILSYFISHAFVNFKETTQYFRRSAVVGIPVRSDLVFKPREKTDKLKVLIFGGSQGARGINNTVLEAVKRGGSWLDKVRMVHQTGQGDYQRISKEYAQLARPQVECLEFLYDMPVRYQWADLIFCRSGASTLAELAVMKKAAVLIPFPFAADNHQMKNAQALGTKGAAIVVSQDKFTPEKFVSLIEEMIADSTRLSGLEGQVESFHVPHSAENIVKVLAVVQKQ